MKSKRTLPSGFATVGTMALSPDMACGSTACRTLPSLSPDMACGSDGEPEDSVESETYFHSRRHSNAQTDSHGHTPPNEYARTNLNP